jgi:CAAX protease family protein
MAVAQISTIILVLVVSIVLIVTGLKKQPGLGIIGTIIIIALTLWLREEPITALGFDFPQNWGAPILLGLLLGLLIQLLAVALIEPLSEKITKTAHDHSVVESVKGNWKALVQWLLIVWIFVAILEEGIYRGFLMTEIAKVAGVGTGALLFNVMFTSIVFGLSHGYQSRSGILSTGVIGVLLGYIFVFSEFNLWTAVLTHGFIDTVGIGLIMFDGDKTIRQKLWKNEQS